MARIKKKGNNALLFLGVGTFCLLCITFLAATRTGLERTYTNPVLIDTHIIQREKPDNFSGILGIGDPSVLFHEGKYYLYPTGDNSGYDVYISDDLVNWQKGPRVFESSERGVWAPDVFYNIRDDKFYLYYTVNGRIGVATANKPDDVFMDHGTLIENAIDAHMFLDEDGKYYLYYTQYPGFKIYVQSMDSPAQKKGEPVFLISAIDPWETKHAAITEAPWMLKYSDTYYLLYSASGADSPDYAIGYATSLSPIGPFIKNSDNPLIERGNNIFGPGHCSITKSNDGKLWMIYHQQKTSERGWNRIICIDPIWFDDQGKMYGKASRAKPHPAPSILE